MKEKNIQIDNLKAVLMVLVVLGHFGSTRNQMYRGLIAFIYSFHMPLFLFLSGYLSKNLERIRKKAVKEYLLVFLVAQLIWAVSKYLIFNDPYYFQNPLEPGFGLWYLLSIFVYRLLLKDLVKIPFLPWIAFVCGIAVMGFGSLEHMLDIQRMVGFFFFFLLGYYTSKEQLEKIEKIPKTLAILVLCMGYLGFYFVIRGQILPYSTLTKLLQHQLLLQDAPSIIVGTIYYLIGILLALVFGIMVIRLIPKNNTFISYLGADTLPLYLSHTYVIVFYREMIKDQITDSVLEIPILLLFTIASLWFFSTKMYRRQFHGLKELLERAIKIDR